MIIKNIGIELEDDIINKTYRTYQAKQYAKICEDTNFSIGRIAFEDGIFLPEGTYVLIKEEGKKDVLGKIFYYDAILQELNDLYHEVAIVDVHYDMSSSKCREKMNGSLIKAFIKKDIYIHRNKHNNKYLQVVQYEHEANDDWCFVKVEYGNPNSVMFYMYGYQYYNNEIYEKQDINSNKLSCFNKHHSYIKIQKIEDYQKDNVLTYLQTNVAYKVLPNVMFVPGETELIIFYLILLVITFIFQQWYFYWICITFGFLCIRKNLRKKYNG